LLSLVFVYSSVCPRVLYVLCSRFVCCERFVSLSFKPVSCPLVPLVLVSVSLSHSFTLSSVSFFYPCFDHAISNPHPYAPANMQPCFVFYPVCLFADRSIMGLERQVSHIHTHIHIRKYVFTFIFTFTFTVVLSVLPFHLLLVCLCVHSSDDRKASISLLFFSTPLPLHYPILPSPLRLLPFFCPVACTPPTVAYSLCTRICIS